MGRMKRRSSIKRKNAWNWHVMVSSATWFPSTLSWVKKKENRTGWEKKSKLAYMNNERDISFVCVLSSIFFSMPLEFFSLTVSFMLFHNWYHSISVTNFFCRVEFQIIQVSNEGCDKTFTKIVTCYRNCWFYARIWELL